MESTEKTYHRLNQDPPIDGNDTEVSPNSTKEHLNNDVVEDSGMAVISDESHGTNKKLPRMINKIFNVQTFLVVACYYIMTSFMVETYLFAVITTLEKRFGFSSSASGVLFSIKEIAYVCVVTPASYYGDKFHKPRFLSILAIIGTFGAALSALPHFVYDTPTHILQNSSQVTIKGESDAHRYLCAYSAENSKLINDNTLNVSLDNQEGACGGSSETAVAHNHGAYAMFAVSCFITGAYESPMISLTTTYVDDAVGPVKNAFYLAFMHMMRGLGPVLAFLMGALFTSYHETMKDPGYDETDPRWIGAWWVGYIINPCLLLLAGILIAFFPRSFSKRPDIEEKEDIELKNKNAEEKKKRGTFSVIGMLYGLGRLLRNPAYICLMLGACFSTYIMSGMLPFTTKYLEVQFHLSASRASALTGTMGALTGCIGVLLGGFICSYMKWKPSQCVLVVLATNVVLVCTLLIMMMMSCSNVDYVGGPQSPGNTTCNALCGCSENDLSPVCGSDGVTYMSACVAGCQQSYNNQTYSDCSCLSEGESGWATVGSCDNDCPMMKVYMAVMAVGSLIGAMASVPGTTICLRIVEERDRSLAVGFIGTVVSLLSFACGPVIYGALIDATCIKWNEICGNTGNCQLYDRDDFRYRLHGVTAVLKAIAGLFYLAIWILMRRREKNLTFSAVPSKDVNAESERAL